MLRVLKRYGVTICGFQRQKNAHHQILCVKRIRGTQAAMARKKLIRTKSYPYHIYARANNKEDFPLPKSLLWNIFSTHLKEASEQFGLRIHNFVLMTNHFHMIASTPNENIDDIMEWFQREMTRAINFRTNKINHVFGGPYRWSLITHDFYYQQAYRYICQNPIRAGMCKRVEDYPWSTIHYLYKKKKLLFRVVENFYDSKYVFDYPIAGKLELLNTIYKKEDYEEVRLALKHRVFKMKSKKRYAVNFDSLLDKK